MPILINSKFYKLMINGYENQILIKEEKYLDYNYLEDPIIISPINNTSDVSLTPIITINNPIIKFQSITLKEVQVSTSNTFSTITWSSGQVVYSTSTTIGITLSKNTTYYVRIRLNGSKTGWTNWSNIISFTTINVAVGDYWDYTTPGSYNFTVPGLGTYKIEVGAGGGGGSYNYSVYHVGGTGGYSKSELELSKNQIISLTVGAGGPSSAVYGSNGTVSTSGGNSSFGSYLYATGGQGAISGIAHGAHGIGVNGNIENVTGGAYSKLNCGRGENGNYLGVAMHGRILITCIG